MTFFNSVTFKDKFEDCGGISSGFDYLRLVLSVLVIAFHSIVICYGSSVEISLVTRFPFRGFAWFILPAFFSLSGFLVASSLLRARSLVSFLSLRAVRIFPALCFEIFVWALIFGPLLSSYSASQYFTDAKFYSYFLNIVGDIHYQLPGLFLNNPKPDVVNQQLWTIPFELDCYILLAVLGIAGVVKRNYLIFVPILVGTLWWPFKHLVLHVPFAQHNFPTGNFLVLCFILGVGFNLFQSRIIYNRWLFIAAAISGYLLLQYEPVKYFAPLPVTYATVYLGCLKPRKLFFVSDKDYSYGLYLYGFPIQQALAMLLPNLRIWWCNFLLALFFAVLMAMLSWNFVEDPIRRRKKSIVGFIQSCFDSQMKLIRKVLLRSPRPAA